MSERERPNVVWIAMEDTSPRLGCYGDEVARTPEIDRLAASGRRFPNAFVTAPVCAPSRSAIVTGCHQNAIGTHHMRTTHTNEDAPGLATPYETVPPHYVRGITEYFRQAGYYCTLDLKTDYQFGEPFTMWDHHGEGAGWWDDAREDGQPFFAMVTNFVTHESGMWEPAQRGPETGGTAGDGGDETLETDPDTVDVPPYLADTEATRRAIARQYDNVAASDAWVGDLLERLERDGLAENTIVVLWSDHGEGLPRAKRWVYQGGVNVPLIVRWPGVVDGGSVDERVVSLVDLGPTMLAACGLERPRHLDGRPFLAEASAEAERPREYAFVTRDRYDESYDVVRSVRDERFTYVRHAEPGRPYRLWIPFRNRHPAMADLLRLDAEDALTGAQTWVGDRRPAEELYDRANDPHETENLADDPSYAADLERLRGVLDDWLERVDDAGARSEARQVFEGWQGDEQPQTAQPAFVPNAPGEREERTMNDGGTLAEPATLSVHCSTQGASVGYTLEDGDDPHWRLYTGPIPLETGETTVRTKAIRYGYGESEERAATFVVEES
ncbi:sulfatase-like hydrolase/transferase [Natronobiforma cellulositropha]|uniref:sulfatase-like hydrolase/transferase n=1 Tax=Natronobiforma cellulositropha TaxID=1679076 RepID=UPI0021D5758F|nr:sulfatase-like hydrolase/transferase [Natronobiforma cellulositropha]